MSDTFSDVDKQKAALALAYRDIFENHPGGRLVLIDILREAGILVDSTVPGDPFATHFNDGRRSLAVTILERLRWDEMALIQFAQQRGEPHYNPIAPDAGITRLEPDNGDDPPEAF